MKQHLVPVLMAAAWAAASAHGSVVALPVSYTTSYNITLAPNFNDVTNIIIFENGAGFGSATWAFSASDFGGDGGTSTITNPFTTSGPVVTAFLLGLVANLPGDIVSTEHVVLFTSVAQSTALAGAGWSAAFPNTNENALIAAIQLATDGKADYQPGFGVINAFLDPTHIVEPGVTTSGDGQNLYFSTSNPISAVAFSTGQVIGSGTTTITPNYELPAPEPATMAMLGLGLCLGGLIRRRKV
jgi:hypothetical protein